jgi:uncharacterized protein YwgA
MADALDVARLVYLNGGQLVGKTRLQKSAYFLDAKDAGFGFDFSYHRFGPYSEDLANAADEAKALNLVEVAWKQSQAGAEYAIFFSKAHEWPSVDPDDRRRNILAVLKEYSAIEVELAATADFLKRNGFASDPWAETQRRKAAKVNAVRLQNSKQLLIELDAIE